MRVVIPPGALGRRGRTGLRALAMAVAAAAVIAAIRALPGPRPGRRAPRMDRAMCRAVIELDAADRARAIDTGELDCATHRPR